MASAEALTEIPTILVVEDDDAIQELEEDA
jgi:hypothetical protein